MQLSASYVGCADRFDGKRYGLLQITFKSCVTTKTDNRSIGFAQCGYGNNTGYATEASGENEDVTESDALGNEAACDWPQAWSLRNCQ